MSTHYICATCGAAGDPETGTPLPPNHVCATDAHGLTPAQRFESLSQYFLRCLHNSGIGRAALYTEKRTDAYGTHSEADLVWHWARQLSVPLLEIQDGITRAFCYAGERAQTVTSFRYCQVWIVQRLQKKGPPL